MRYLFFAIIAQAITFTALGQKPDCKSLHTGSFKIFAEQSGTTFIKRTQKEQIEKNDDLGYEVIFDLKWITPCTYELRPKKLIKGDPSIMGDGTSFVRTRIKNIDSKSYTAETTASFMKDTIDFVVEIIN